MTISEIVQTAKACSAAGAGAIHAHVRDKDQQHVLDAGLYRELLAELQRQVPDMVVQVTTEAVGRYSPAEQRAVVREAHPRAFSAAISEMMSEGDEDAAREFYHWTAEAGIAAQHIFYLPDDGAMFFDLLRRGVVPHGPLELLFVLGRYAKGQNSAPEDLTPYLEMLKAESGETPIEWGVCAFGRGETDCLAHAAGLGGKVRVGFENSIWNADGEVAKDNAERVAEVASRMAAS